MTGDRTRQTTASELATASLDADDVPGWQERREEGMRERERAKRRSCQHSSKH